METRKYLAELVGTFLFMTIGYSSVAAFGIATVPGLLVVPFSFGFGLLAAIFAVGHISGGHFNPAVTVAAVLDGRTPHRTRSATSLPRSSAQSPRRRSSSSSPVRPRSRRA